MNVYDFRPGRSIKNVDPQALGEALDDLRKEKGHLVPEDVVELCRPQDSPFHHALHWDDKQAADAFRLQEARRLITCVRVLNGPAAKPSVAYVSVRSPELKRRTYVPMTEALSDTQMRERVLAEARQAIESLEKRWAHFAEVADVLANLKKAVG